MTLRVLVLALTFCLGFIVPASAKDAPKKAAVSKPAKKAALAWRDLIDLVINSGAERPIERPLSINLGFQSDSVATKAMRFDSEETPDKKDHAFYVVYNTDSSGKNVPTSVILGNNLPTEVDGKEYSEIFFARLDLGGKIVAALKGKGLAADVVQTTLNPQSSGVKVACDFEKSLYLKKMDIGKLLTK